MKITRKMRVPLQNWTISQNKMSNHLAVHMLFSPRTGINRAAAQQLCSLFMTTEEQQEQRYWRLSLFFILLSPLAVYQLFGLLTSLKINLFIFIASLFLCMPLTLVVDTIAMKLFDRASPLRFWVVKPSDEVRHLLSHPAQPQGGVFQGLGMATLIKTTATAVNDRLTELKFQTDTREEADGSSVITFQKRKQAPVLSFMDHSFSGEARVKFFGSAVEVRIRTTFNDTLLLETGEFGRIRGLGEYLALKTHQLSFRNVPLSLYCGLNLAFLATLLTIIPYLNRQVGHTALTSVAAAGGGMVVASLILMQRKRGDVFGYRLALAGAYLSLLPFVAGFLRVALRF